MDDKTRWNEKHKNPLMPVEPSHIVKQYIYETVKSKTALDIACGTGRHTHYLDGLNYQVDAIDISDYGLSKINASPNIKLIEADLSCYTIEPNRYDLIININYLERKLFPSIISGLKIGGLLVFETFVQADGDGYAQPSNPDYLLKQKELLEVFNAFTILEYCEYDSINMHQEKVKIASLAAIK